MPVRFKKIADQQDRYSWVFLGDIDERLSERLDVSALDGTDLIDEYGYLVPGSVLIFSANNLLPVSAPGSVARGVVLEAVKVADSNSTEDLTAAEDVDVVIVVAGTIDQALAANNLGRAYTADEIEAFNANDALILTAPTT